MTITLRELVTQVREELLAPPDPEATEALYPFLFVEEVELELAVGVKSAVEGSGKVSIRIIELGGGGKHADEETHRIKIKLTPLLTKEELRQLLQEDKALWDKVKHLAFWGTLKGDAMVGEW